MQPLNYRIFSSARMCRTDLLPAWVSSIMVRLSLISVRFLEAGKLFTYFTNPILSRNESKQSVFLKRRKQPFFQQTKEEIVKYMVYISCLLTLTRVLYSDLHLPASAALITWKWIKRLHFCGLKLQKYILTFLITTKYNQIVKGVTSNERTDPASTQQIFYS